MKHLWEINHPYYCSESNYFATGLQNRELMIHYKSFAEFLADWKDSDLDLNLMFRFDWSEVSEDGEPSYKGDDNYRNGTLHVFWMLQRKGIFQTSTIEVCRNDEPLVIEFLRPRWSRMLRLWEGISDLTEGLK